MVDILQILAAWIAFCLTKRTRGDTVSPLLALVKQYREKHRSYHDLSHIVFGLTELWRCRYLAEDFWALLFAWLYHDYFYDIGIDTKNEQRSARAAYAIACDLGLGGRFALDVHSLILTTVYDVHQLLPTTQDHMLISDVDLAIFGQSARIFDRYERKVRREYAHVPLERFCSARAEILARFLNRKVGTEPRIYLTTYFHTRYNKQARLNLSRALNRFEVNQQWYSVAM